MMFSFCFVFPSSDGGAAGDDACSSDKVCKILYIFIYEKAERNQKSFLLPPQAIWVCEQKQLLVKRCVRYEESKFDLDIKVNSFEQTW